jgi:hypothetical protein
MRPVLRTSDNLCVVPYRGQRIRRGDVVVFRRPGGGGWMAHRVVDARSGTLKTRGDNNVSVDPWRVSRRELAGLVVRAERGSRRIRVRGGFAGRAQSLLLRPYPLTREGLRRLFRPVYLRLAATGILRPCLPRRLRPRVVAYRRGSGTELRLLLGNLPAGVRPAGRRRWIIRPPFRLFVDEELLPGGDP